MAYDIINGDSRRTLVDVIGFDINGGQAATEQSRITIKEIVLGESLLTPGLQTAVTIQSDLYYPQGKNFDRFKAPFPVPIRFTLNQNYPSQVQGGVPEVYNLAVNQIVYRLDNRKFLTTNISSAEEFVVHACDMSLLNDARSLVSKSWKCTKPSDIVQHVLQQCAGVGNIDMDQADPSRDYIAENIHPFQVVAQQANVALYQGVPDFVHFMTYGWTGGGGSTPVHHFRSLKSLCEADSIATYTYGETGADLSMRGGYKDLYAALSVEFPCDFDILADFLNGVDENGNYSNSLGTLDSSSGIFDFKGGQARSGCGIGRFNYKAAMSNKDTTKQRDSCNLDVETHLLLRQARMSLLERDKIAMRIVVPWNPLLHAGKVITLDWRNKNAPEFPVYGSGKYLISSLTHTWRAGGFGTTTMDCVSKTIGSGTT